MSRRFRLMPRRIPHFLARSVRGRLVLLVAALVVPVVALASAMILQAYRNEHAAVANTLMSTARGISAVVDAKLAESESVLSALAASDALAHDDFAACAEQARQAFADDGIWFALLDPDGATRIDTRLPPGGVLPRTELDAGLRGTLAAGRTYVSNLRRSRSTGEFVVHVARPYFRNGRVKYLLSISITPAAMARAIDVDRYAPGKIVTLVDRAGVIVARNRNAEKFVGGSATPDMVAATAATAEAMVDSVTLERIPVVVAFSHTACGWSVLIGAPKTELYASARQLLLLGGVGSSLLILVAIVMALWIGRALVRSTDMLEADATLLGSGEAPREVSTGLDESDFVANAMRRMAATLLRRTHTLEVLNRITATLVAERDISRIVASVTAAGRELSGAEFGALIHRSGRPGDDTLQLHLLIGDEHRAYPAVDLPLTGDANERATDMRVPDAASRLAQLLARIAPGRNFRSGLAVPIRNRTGETAGWLVYAHRDAGVFTAETEHVIAGLAAEAAIGLDNAKLYQALARELEAKSRAEAELRVAQERLSEHARELERKVDERTASLREAVAQMEEFSYTVSHDLRSPLRAMHAFAEALMEDYGAQLDDTARDYVRRIQRASLRMDQLTTNLLSYSRVARTEVQLQPIDPERIVRSTIEHYAELQAPRAEVRIASPLLPVQAHEASLTQCLANLLTNAAKFVPPGEKPQISVRTERHGDRVRIWIEDQGIGILPQHQGKLFAIFERVPQKTQYEGTGVGLAIVRKAAEKMGGHCGVESDGVSGSRFWIELAAA